jgi:hypothetical protein
LSLEERERQHSHDLMELRRRINPDVLAISALYDKPAVCQ